MGRKIILIGQDRIRKTRISTLLEQYELTDFEYIRFPSIHKAKHVLLEGEPCLVLMHMNRGETIDASLDYLQENHPYVPVILIMTADGRTSQTLMRKGVHHVIHPDHVDEISLTQVIPAAVEQKRVENELRTRDAILQAVNYAAEVFLSQSDWEPRINEVLARLGRVTQSDRVYIYKN